ncbi:hypothetical protein HK104_002277, partial [Borealophlyctis nickersoniae]
MSHSPQPLYHLVVPQPYFQPYISSPLSAGSATSPPTLPAPDVYPTEMSVEPDSPPVMMAYPSPSPSPNTDTIDTTIHGSPGFASTVASSRPYAMMEYPGPQADHRYMAPQETMFTSMLLDPTWPPVAPPNHLDPGMDQDLKIDPHHPMHTTRLHHHHHHELPSSPPEDTLMDHAKSNPSIPADAPPSLHHAHWATNPLAHPWDEPLQGDGLESHVFLDKGLGHGLKLEDDDEVADRSAAATTAGDGGREGEAKESEGERNRRWSVTHHYGPRDMELSRI